jgi:hypothetical protein
MEPAVIQTAVRRKQKAFTTHGQATHLPSLNSSGHFVGAGRLCNSMRRNGRLKRENFGVKTIIRGTNCFDACGRLSALPITFTIFRGMHGRSLATRTHWQHIDKLLGEALELEAGRRAAFLDQA